MGVVEVDDQVEVPRWDGLIGLPVDVRYGQRYYVEYEGLASRPMATTTSSTSTDTWETN